MSFEIVITTYIHFLNLGCPRKRFFTWTLPFSCSLSA